MSKHVMGFTPRRRHIVVENRDKDGKPDGTYICLTCLREDRRRP